MTAVRPTPRAPYLVLAILLTVLGAASLVLEQSEGWGGFNYGMDRVIRVVEPNTAGEAAGLQSRDSLVSIDGRPAIDLPMQSRWARTGVGESHRLEVVRDGRRLTVEVEYARRGPNLFGWGARLLLLAFLWCGVWARLTIATPAAAALAHAGLAAGVAMAAPLTVGGIWSGMASHVQAASLVLVTMFLLRLFLVFPVPKPVSASRLAGGALAGVWLALVALLVVELFVHPRLYLKAAAATGILMLVVLALALAALAHTVATTPRGTLWRSGVGWALLAVVVGVLALVAPFAAMAVRLPLALYAGLLVAAAPIMLALAVRKQANAATATT